MKEKGFTTYQLREKCGIDSRTVRRLKANDNVETKTLNKLCEGLSCSLDDIAEYKKQVIKVFSWNRFLMFHTMLKKFLDRP